MERECFEDEDIAKLLNENFISIKVDREERPDIDSIYMGFCQAITGSGGWPLTIFMTYDKKPFYAGTYFPKESAYGRPGLMQLLKHIGQQWKEDKESFFISSEDITKQVKKAMFSTKPGKLSDKVITSTYKELKESFEEKYGGFSIAPKFPSPHLMHFLMHYYEVNDESKALSMVEDTLQHMYKGGIFDHVGFGFSRYSTDKKWLVPHFEKMLYDNALLLMAYTEAYSITKNPLYKEISEKIVVYLMRTMVSPEGAFYCAEDADSEGVEGKFYVWSPESIKSVLGTDEGSLFCNYYDITDRGNFEGKSIPNLIITDIKKAFADDELKSDLERCIAKLYDSREGRVHPHKDTKILTSWNGLMIAALAYAGRVFNNKEYISYSERAMEFILKSLVDYNGRLLARYRDGESAYKGLLDDYSYLIWGLMELYSSTLNTKYLALSKQYADKMIELFYDNDEGGFYLYSKDSEELLMRPKEIYDGAMPSGNSSAIYNLARLFEITFDDKYNECIERTLNCFGRNIERIPSAHALSISAFMYLSKARNIIICGKKDDEKVKEAVKLISENFLPFTTIVINDVSPEILSINPDLSGYTKIEDKVTFYVCQNKGCLEPITDITALEAILRPSI